MSSNPAANPLAQLAVSSFLYRNVGPAMVAEPLSFFSADTPDAPPVPVAPGVPQEEVNRQLAQARTEAAAETRRQMQGEVAAKVAEYNAQLEEALNSFQQEQKKYFLLAEKEIVQLSLAVSERILHREAQVDPLLVAGLVRVAIEKLASGSTVTVRVSPEQSEYWRAYRANTTNGLTVIVVEDSEMKATDCVLETDLGSVDFSIEAQLKEVEQGFCDLLALRPKAA